MNLSVQTRFTLCYQLVMGRYQFFDIDMVSIFVNLKYRQCW